MPKLILIITLAATASFLFYIYLFKPTPTTLPTTSITINNRQFTLEIATSLTDKSKGLSARSSLCPDCGMIFVYPRPTTLPFWMKDTLIPLDMIWLDNSGKIVHLVTANPQPDTPSSKLTVYQNSSPAQYVVELNAGVANQLNLKLGDTIPLPDLP